VSYDPENFGDVADLAGVVQRRQNLNELRSLNASLQSSQESAKLRASLQDVLFNFKIMTDRIDKVLNAGQPECLLMIHTTKAQFESSGFGHEMFPSLEYKNLLIHLDNYFAEIENRARSILGDNLYEKGQAQVLANLRKQQLEKEAAERAEKMRLKTENDERTKSDNQMWLIIVGIIVLFSVLGIILMINNPSKFKH